MKWYSQLDPSFRKIFVFVTMFGGVFLFGVVGYHVIEGWSVLDSLYMTVITVSTVGYGETHQLTDPGRYFTIFMIFAGMSVALYALSEVTAFVVEGEMTGALKKRKMTKQIEKLSGHYILCGMGRTGHYVLQEMQKTERPCVVIELEAARAQEMIDANVLCVQGDATNDNILHAAGIDRAAGLMTALPTDRDNLFVVISARALNKNIRIVSKIEDVTARQKFLHSGADTGVSTHFIGGLRMASELVRPAAVTFLDTMLRGSGNWRVEDAPVGMSSKYIGTKLGELDIVANVGALLMAIQQQGVLHFNPAPETLINGGDAIIVMGTPDQVNTLKEKLK